MERLIEIAKDDLEIAQLIYSNGKYSVRFSFDQFIMALDYLYIIGAIKKDERGKISYEIN